MKKFSLLIAVAFSAFAFRAEKKAFQIFTSDGKSTSFTDILNAAKEADIVLFGELHDNPIIHWLQLELTGDLHALKKDQLVLGAEMLEADDQLCLEEYLAGKISERTYKDEMKLWPNYGTDYKPLVDFAKTNKLSFIATNVPRRYANMVYSKGMESLDSLGAEAKKFIVPLPFRYDGSLKCYKDILESAAGHNGENLAKSQALKDATMAHFILKNQTPGKLFLHYNGTYHSDNKQGIAWYLLLNNPKLKIVVITSSLQADCETLDKNSLGKGDFIICTPENMTRTH
ncbi:MAG TPA: ChaN family lipoprotein [Bacteroidia bacterium]|nr:ChaN family lipoprotein [Bacteroidia bacterium]